MGILSGLRVIDMSQGAPTAVATMLLAEAGAEVIKVEPPEGDWTRSLAGFATWNRSKRSVVLDLDVAHDRDELTRLIRTADVLVHNERPASAKALGVDDEELRRRQPRLVVCAVTRAPVGHGDEDRPYDPMLAEARIGFMGEQPGYRPGPVYLRYPISTYGTVYLVIVGILARLIARERTGLGGPAHTSLVQGGLSQLMMKWSMATKPTPQLEGASRDPGWASLFECGDGQWIHVMSAVDGSPLMAKTMAELDPKEVARLAEESSVGGLATRFPNLGATQAAFRRHPAEEWLADFWANDIAVQPSLPPGEVFFDEQARINGYVVEVDDPVHGRTRQAGNGLHVSPPTAVQRPAPTLGEATEEILGAFADVPNADVPIAATTTDLRFPLEGIRVLDFGQYLAGPYGPMLLADLGAEVIKIERTGGDPMRNPERVFAGCQRGKRSLAIDMRSPEVADVVAELVRSADIVHHNIRLPAARRLGIDYESLSKIKPDIIFGHVSNYGPTGPRADWPGFDQLAQAQCGWEVAGAGEGNPPVWHAFGMMDYQGAFQSLTATLLALYHRFRTGEGQGVAGSILGGGTLTMSELLVRPDGTLSEFLVLDHEQTGVSPGVRIYQAADGWVALAARDDATFERALRAVGLEDGKGLEAAVRALPASDVVARWDQAHVPADLVSEQAAQPFFEDPRNIEVGLVASYPHPVYETLVQIGKLWDFGDLDVQIHRAPPEIGQHSREVLLEAGIDSARIDDLVTCGTIVDNPEGRRN